jgi:hypothetical protein
LFQENGSAGVFEKLLYLEAILFSIVVLRVFISLLLVTVGIIYNRMGSKIEVIIGILFDGENISFDASLVMYINSTSISPIMIMNWMYENQKLLYIVPLIKHTIVVCISSISPMAMFQNEKVKL